MEAAACTPVTKQQAATQTGFVRLCNEGQPGDQTDVLLARMLNAQQKLLQSAMPASEGSDICSA